ncbi:MAG: hypothetical protein DCF26_03800 [Burkholderiales bacterium]|nr:MAG: hypothetical protein DCF26_03800 [Burkholderiales bacterium]
MCMCANCGCWPTTPRRPAWELVTPCRAGAAAGHCRPRCATRPCASKPTAMPDRCAATSMPWSRNERRVVVTAALLIGSGQGLAAHQVRLLDVWINGQSADANAFIVEEDGRFFASAQAMAAWRLKPVDLARSIDGVPHHGLYAWRPQLRASTQRLELSAGSAAFTGQVLNMAGSAQASAALSENSLGLALDYTLNMDRYSQDNQASQSSAYLDLRAFGLPGQGGLRHSGVLQLGALPGNDPRFRRLDTAWYRADPDTLWRTTVGDTLSCGGELAPTLRFAGVQVRSDFGLQPEQVYHPLPSVQGSAQVPSGIDLLINDRPAGSVAVGSGPFSLDTLPTVTGAGEIRIVQRDLQGIEQVRSVPYYTSPRLLRSGLTDSCFEAGALRLNYGLPSDRYAERFAAVSVRHGWSNTLTAQARVETSELVRSLRVGGHWIPSQWAVLSAQSAFSQTDGVGSGHSLRLGMERITRQYHLSASIESADDNFRQLDGSRAPSRRTALFGGWTLGQTSWSAGGIWQIGATGVRTRVLTASMQRRVGADWHMGLSALQRERRWSLAVMLTRQLDTDTTVAVLAQGGREDALTVQAQRYEPATGGQGWRVQGSTGQARALGAWSHLGDAGRVELQAARLAGSNDTAVRATASGDVIWLGGMPVLGRSLGEGVAAQIEVEGMPGVGVQLNHRDVAVTDQHGRAWLYGLQPWEDNVIGISAEALPMDMLLSFPEMRLRPRAQSVVQAKFPARRSRSVLLEVLRPDGEPVAAGSRARRTDEAPGSGAPFAQDGKVFLNDVQDVNRIRIEGPQGVCHLLFQAPDAAIIQPEIGPLTCQEHPP